MRASLFSGLVIFICLSVFGTFAHGEKIRTGYININKAAKKELLLLPGIGNKRADKIIRARKRRRFSQAHDLVDRKIVPGKIYTRLRHFIVTSGASVYETDAPKKQTGAKGSRAVFDQIFTTSSRVSLLPDRLYKRMLREKIEHARFSIRMSAYVFLFSKKEKNQSFQLAKLLGQKAEQGVTVKIVLEKSDRNTGLTNSNIVSSTYLKKHGVFVYFDNPKRTGHAKLAVIDSRWVFVGSHNLTHSALNNNGEFTIMLDSPEIAFQVIQYIDRLALKE